MMSDSTAMMISSASPASASAAPPPLSMGGVSTTVLRMRGLPYSATSDVVRQFFSNYVLAPGEDAILIITQGFHRGEGYVRFADENTCQAAHTALNRGMLQERYIELYPSNEAAFEAARQQQQQLSQEVHFVVRMRGLPFAAQPDTIRTFFEALGPKIINITMVAGADGRFTGDAFIDFATQDAQREAITYDRRSIGPRYVEIFESSAQERDGLIMSARRHARGGRGGPAAGGAYGMRGGGGGYGGMMAPVGAAAGGAGFMGNSGGAYPPMGVGGYGGSFMPGRGRGGGGYGAMPLPATPGIGPGVVRVRGLPFHASEADVAEFLQGVNIRPQGVHMVFNANERPTGEAFVEVVAERDVDAALRLHRGMMGNRYVEVYRSNNADILRLQGLSADAPAPHGPHGPGGYGEVPATMVPGGYGAGGYMPWGVQQGGYPAAAASWGYGGDRR